MIRFQKFVAADAAQNLESTRKAVTEARQKIDAANLAPVDDPTLAEIKQDDEGLAEAVIAHQAAWAARREWISNCYMLSQWTDSRPPLPDGDALSTLLLAKAKTLRQLATQLRQAKDQKEHAKLTAELAELTSRRDLGTHLPAIRTHISEATRRGALDV